LVDVTSEGVQLVQLFETGVSAMVQLQVSGVVVDVSAVDTALVDLV
jgi:hypothetical protein